MGLFDRLQDKKAEKKADKDNVIEVDYFAVTPESPMLKMEGMTGYTCHRCDFDSIVLGPESQPQKCPECGAVMKRYDE